MSLFEFGLFSDPFADMRRMERQMSRLARRMDSYFDDDDMSVDTAADAGQQRLLSNANGPEATSGEVATTQPEARSRSVAAWRPQVDVKETDKEYVVRAELPGVRKEDVSIEVRRDGPAPVLVLRGSKNDETAQQAGTWHRVERRFGEFSRTFALPQGVEPEKLSAKYENGVLELVVPKPPQAPQPLESVRRIEIH
eukprot:m51a1_g4643 putative heat shock protein hsp20 (196) ;mRNA; r:349085-349672